MSFTDKETVKHFLNKEELGQLEEIQIDMLIEMIDGLIEDYCGWKVLSNVYTNKKYDGTGLSQLDLKVFPISNVISVVVTDSGGIENDVTADVLLKEEDGVIYLSSTSASLTTFTSGTRNVKVSFTGGYSEIPVSLKMAATELVVRYFNRVTTENVGISKERFEQDEVEYDKIDITPAIAKILDKYKRFIIV